jgi:outer membrane autotransporter protein
LEQGPNGFSSLVPKGNAGAVAACLNNLFLVPGSDLTFVLEQLLFAPDVKTLKHALNQMQPSQLNALQLSQENTNTRLFSVLSSRMGQIHRACKPQEQTWDFWIDGFGDALQQDHQDGEYGFHTATGAALVGFDGHLLRRFHLGIGGAYTWTSLDWSGDHGKGNISSGYGFAYGTWKAPRFFLDTSFLGAYNGYKANRHVDFLAIDRHAHSNHSGYTLAGSLTAGVPFRISKVEIAPLASLEYDFLHQQKFKEHGAQSLNLRIHAKNSNLLRGEIGFRVTRRCQDEIVVQEKPRRGWSQYREPDVRPITSSAKWLPSFQLTAIREWRFQGRYTKASLQDVDCVFKIHGMNPDRTLISPAFGLTWLTRDRLSLTLDYAGEFAMDGKYWEQKGNFQLNYAF